MLVRAPEARPRQQLVRSCARSSFPGSRPGGDRYAEDAVPGHALGLEVPDDTGVRGPRCGHTRGASPLRGAGGTAAGGGATGRAPANPERRRVSPGTAASATIRARTARPTQPARRWLGRSTSRWKSTATTKATGMPTARTTSTPLAVGGTIVATDTTIGSWTRYRENDTVPSQCRRRLSPNARRVRQGRKQKISTAAPRTPAGRPTGSQSVQSLTNSFIHHSPSSTSRPPATRPPQSRVATGDRSIRSAQTPSVDRRWASSTPAANTNI